MGTHGPASPDRQRLQVYTQSVGAGQHGCCGIGRQQHHRIFRLRGVYLLQGRLRSQLQRPVRRLQAVV